MKFLFISQKFHKTESQTISFYGQKFHKMVGAPGKQIYIFFTSDIILKHSNNDLLCNYKYVGYDLTKLSVH